MKAYQCPAGIWTVGYGHTGPEVHEALIITGSEADALLHADLKAFDAGVAKACPEATNGQHAAMVSLAFNIGLGNFTRSSVARLHNSRKYSEAAQAFALWNKTKGIVLAGLVARRASEAALYLSDTLTQDAAPEVNAQALG